MNQTINFGLNQWSSTDRIRMEDFNADNAKIDAALAGIPKIAVGSYIGTGTYGSANPNSLTFDFAPLLLIISASHSATSGAGTIFVRGQTQNAGMGAQYNGFSLNTTVSWDENTVIWYTTRDDVERQLNLSGITYHYLALGI